MQTPPAEIPEIQLMALCDFLEKRYRFAIQKEYFQLFCFLEFDVSVMNACNVFLFRLVANSSLFLVLIHTVIEIFGMNRRIAFQ